MPNVKSAKKELRKSAKGHVYNKNIKDNMKALIKKCVKAIEAGDIKGGEELIKQSLKAIDKAAQKGVIKKNTRDRKKSRLHRKFNKAKTGK